MTDAELNDRLLELADCRREWLAMSPDERLREWQAVVEIIEDTGRCIRALIKEAQKK